LHFSDSQKNKPLQTAERARHLRKIGKKCQYFMSGRHNLKNKNPLKQLESI
jgi:hypothetical protein